MIFIFSPLKTNGLLMEKKPCTTYIDVQNLVNNGINYLSTGAGFLPSKVSLRPET